MTSACSSRRYHIVERKTNAGWQTVSKMPSNVRTMTRPVKFLHRAVHARMAPQAEMLVMVVHGSSML